MLPHLHTRVLQGEREKVEKSWLRRSSVWQSHGMKRLRAARRERLTQKGTRVRRTGVTGKDAGRDAVSRSANGYGPSGKGAVS